MTIYLRYENRTIAELQRWDMSNSSNAPFIKIGNLLLAIDQTGAEAWQPLINTLKRDYNAKKFILYTGRHGAMEGCFHDDGRVPASAPDISFYNDDLNEANRFSVATGVDIDVVNTSFIPKILYKRRVLTDVATGHWVIVAWCHSIASMCTIPNNANQDYQQGGVLWVSAQNMTRRRVSDIVSEDYAWVPGAA